MTDQKGMRAYILAEALKSLQMPGFVSLLVNRGRMHKSLAQLIYFAKVSIRD